MSISASERVALTCPSCGQHFETDVWVLVDTAEQPELAQALRDGTLDRVVCPHCGIASAAGVALLFHDAAQRRVYFAVPPNVADYAWRERAQELLGVLVDSIPEEARLPYLGDVQVEQEVAGVQRAVLRRDRQTRARQSSAASGKSSVDLMREQLARQTGSQEPGARSQEPGARSQELEARSQELALSPEPSNLGSQLLANELFDAIQELLAADTAEQFRAMVAMHPQLLSESADTMFAQLADAAYEESDRVLAEALHTARRSLQRMRRLDMEAPALVSVDGVAAEMPILTTGDQAGRSHFQSAIDALLHATTTAELMQAFNDYPQLLSAQTDDDLTARIELALEEGNERLAQQIEERREALIELRAATPAESPVLQAIEALLVAEDASDKARVIADYPVLLTDAAHDALRTLVTSARAQGDTTLAEYAAECQAILHAARGHM